MQELKTAFIYQFARLTTWPAKSFKSKDDPLVIAILGSNPLGKHILKLAGKHIGKRTVKVLLIKKLKEALQAQVVFVAWKRDDQQKKTLLVLKQHHILTVGDSTLFAKEGGALHLALVRRKVRFDINLKALKAAGLTVHPKLIKLARRVF